MAEQKLYPCSRCGGKWPRGAFHEARGADRPRPVTSRCRECRSQVYFKRRYPTACAVCAQHRALFQNGICKKCNEADGLRECSKCDALMPVLLKFHGRSRACVDCANELRRRRRARGR